MDDGNFDEAVKSFNEVIARNPKKKDIFKKRGRAFEKKGNFDEAIES